MKSQALQQVALLAGLPPDEIERLATTLREREAAAGEAFILEGDIANGLFIIVHGEVEIIKSLDTPNERVLGVCKAGDFLGEMGLINPGSRRTASVRARTPASLLEMNRGDFDDLLRRRPTLASEVVRVLSSRLDQAQTQTIRDLEAKNFQLTEAYERLKAAQQQLIEKEKMEREMEVARGIQQGMIPRKCPELRGFNFGATMVPARAVGGDFFDFIPLSQDSLGIAIGDVSDKGVPAALFMALTSSMLRAEAKRIGSPGDVLRQVNRQLREINEAEMFVTLLYAVLDATSRRLHYARAGHELPIIYDAQGNLLPLPRSPGLALGIVDEPPIDEQIIELPACATVVFYTDGMTDALNPVGGDFGLNRLTEAVRQGRQASAPDLCAELLRASDLHRASAAPYDDITLLVIRADQELPSGSG
jgi:serine phosphatase RsbU (regulator of sigma subunit)